MKKCAIMFCILIVVLALAVIADNKEEFSVVDELAINEGEEENIAYGETKKENLKDYSSD